LKIPHAFGVRKIPHAFGVRVCDIESATAPRQIVFRDSSRVSIFPTLSIRRAYARVVRDPASIRKPENQEKETSNRRELSF
jgi:hypothetical protein